MSSTCDTYIFKKLNGWCRFVGSIIVHWKAAISLQALLMWLLSLSDFVLTWDKRMNRNLKIYLIATRTLFYEKWLKHALLNHMKNRKEKLMSSCISCLDKITIHPSTIWHWGKSLMNQICMWKKWWNFSSHFFACNISNKENISALHESVVKCRGHCPRKPCRTQSRKASKIVGLKWDGCVKGKFHSGIIRIVIENWQYCNMLFFHFHIVTFFSFFMLN